MVDVCMWGGVVEKIKTLIILKQSSVILDMRQWIASLVRGDIFSMEIISLSLEWLAVLLTIIHENKRLMK